MNHVLNANANNVDIFHIFTSELQTGNSKHIELKSNDNNNDDNNNNNIQ